MLSKASSISLFLVPFEATLLGSMTIVLAREKCSTIVIPLGGKGTHCMITLGFANQLSTQDQAANTRNNERDYIILMRKGGRLVEGTMHCIVSIANDVA